MKKDNKVTSYKDYLESVNKNEIIKMLETFHIDYNKNAKKQELIQNVMDNVNAIVTFTLNLFQIDEYHNIRLFVKKKGKLVIKVNYLLRNFITNLERHHLVIKKDEKTFFLPKELLDIYKKELKKKRLLDKIKATTDEYKLILGFVDAYGIIDFNKFHEGYAKLYKLPKEKALIRIKDIANFYDEFKVYEDKNKIYIANEQIDSLKKGKSLLKKIGTFAVYTNEELISIYDFTYMMKFKSYKKLMKFINRNYYVEKGNFKIINKYVLKPYLTMYQLNPDGAKEVLSSLIDMYFEFNNEKHKDKFIGLVEKLALDYPSWDTKGCSEKDDNN
ncbi:MAG: hypothetical protein E7164_04460 [Firmicutes bacterium]|nr:hypothetical protein [Bacillota bacterium]